MGSHLPDVFVPKLGMRGDELLVEAHVQVAFVSAGRARPIPKPLRIAMKADQESGGAS